MQGFMLNQGKECFVARMSETKPLRCQKCGKPLGYVTVFAKGLTSINQPVQNVKLVAICMDCFQKNS